MHGCYTANKAIDEADLVIAVGTRFSDRVALNPDAFAKRAKIIQIDIDPSELGKNVDIDLEPDRAMPVTFCRPSCPTLKRLSTPIGWIRSTPGRPWTTNPWIVTPN